MKQGPTVSILVIPEDRAAGTEAALKALARHMIRLALPTIVSPWIACEPLADDLKPIAAGQRHGARTAHGYRDRRRLAGEIVSQVCRADTEGFVLYHYDADCMWADRDRRSTKGDAFADLRRVVGALLEEPPGKRAQLPPDARARVERLLAIVPHWEIEAWLYQNTDLAIRICRDRYRGASVDRFEAWARDRGLLDEVEDVKDAACLADHHNDALAGPGLPVAEMEAVGKSFAAAVQSVRGCESLRVALAATVNAAGP